MKYLFLLLASGSLFGQPMFVDARYSAELIRSGNGMTVIDFDSTGRLFIAEKRGRVLVMEPDGSGGFLAASEFANIIAQVDPSDESGLLGMAVDPDFVNTRHLFLFYTTPTDQRLTRITANVSFTGMEPGSELVLLSGLPRLTTVHKAGDIRFHPNDSESIFVALGDDDIGHVVVAGIPICENPDEFAGKILRVSKDNGQGLDTNPFWDGDPTSVRSRVWAVGFRNPFRFTFHPSAPNPDVLYSSENGDATDRVSWVLRGSNGEWNGTDLNGSGFGFLNPTDPNHRILTTMSPSLIGVAVAESGPFAPGGPTIYVANWLSGIRRWNLTGADLDTLTPIASDGGQVFTGDIVGTDLEFGPDGMLYAAWSNGGESLGSFYTIWRVSFSGVTPPTASFTTTPNPAAGQAPLMVDFSDTSSAAGSSIVAWHWDFGDDASSMAQNPSHEYTQPGVYTVRLTVRNAVGQIDTAEQEVRVFRTVQVNLSGTIFDARSLPAAALATATELRFYQLIDGSPIAFSGGIGPQGHALSIASGTLSGTVNLNLTGNGFVVSAGEPAGDGVESALVGVVAPAGQGNLNAALEFYLSTLMIRGRALDYGAQPLEIDVGVARDTAGNWVAIGGGRDFLPGPGQPLSGVAHRRTSDLFGYFHLAIPTATGPGTYLIQAVADTNADLFAARNLQETVTDEWLVDLRVARFAGGDQCDDLSGIPVTANVDYDNQIQPIWNSSCTGCHNPTATNSGGLNLRPGVSEANLIDQPSSFALGMLRVRPGRPHESYLFEKINCGQPQTGNRMRPSNAMALTDQALIRDWIEQLEPDCINELNQQLANWPNQTVLDLVTLACP